MASFVSYLRVSTTRQSDSGLGIEAQREAVRRYLSTVGGNLVQEHVEVETGRLATRPVLLRAIAEAQRQKSVLIIARLDRLARSVSFISSLMETGIEFVAADMPTANKLMLHLMAAFAEFERDLIASRTRGALAAAKARGVVLGRNGQVLALKHKADALAAAEQLREPIQEIIAGGAATLAQIAVQLTALGYRTREGADWSPSTVQRTLKRLALFMPADVALRKGYFLAGKDPSGSPFYTATA